jgi:predicted RNA-binding protein YlqC (UPF0109 family)
MRDEDEAVAQEATVNSSGLDPVTLAAMDPDTPDRTQDAGQAVASLRELVVFLVGNLVDDPEQVSVVAEQRGSLVQIQVQLPESELGKVIGRGGRIAKAIRTALMIAGSRHHLRVSLDIES